MNCQVFFFQLYSIILQLHCSHWEVSCWSSWLLWRQCVDFLQLSSRFPLRPHCWQCHYDAIQCVFPCSYHGRSSSICSLMWFIISFGEILKISLSCVWQHSPSPFFFRISITHILEHFTILHIFHVFIPCFSVDIFNKLIFLFNCWCANLLWVFFFFFG